PRNWKVRGAKRSRARIEDRRGKSAKEVFAVSTSIRAVAICSTNQSGPGPNTVLPICEITVSVAGTTPRLVARNDVPRNIEPMSMLIQMRVVLALRHSGFLKAGTPLEIASVPVKAVQPWAKADMSMNRPSACEPGLTPPAGGV